VIRLLLIFSLCGCSDETSLGAACDRPCYSGPKGTEGVGQCAAGAPVCEPGTNNVTECDEVLPSVEVCDSVDNDCDGETDEELTDEPPDCLTRGECQGTVAGCRKGSWICPYPETVESTSETRCDGLDNDCDGLVDEGIFDSWTVAERSCYGGNPPESIAQLPCHPGVFQCVNAEIVCAGDNTPTKEICDGIDNDCNGLRDDSDDIIEKTYQIVFIIDTSGSMWSDIAAVALALSTYVEQFQNNPSVEFALVNMSTFTVWGDPLVTVEEDFSDIAVIQSALLTLVADGVGYEASLDSMMMVCDQTANTLALSWRPETEAIVLGFTDEPPQTWLHDDNTWGFNGDTLAADVTAACLSHNVLPGMWTLYPSLFEPMLLAANGFHFVLVNDWQSIVDDLNTIEIVPCTQG